MKAHHQEALFWVAVFVAIVAFASWRGRKSREVEQAAAGGLGGS